jgi:septal ring factor EnvC (AmiA/AmiB activator)
MLKTLFSGLFILAFSGTLLAQTQSSDELKKKQTEIQREIDELRQSLNDTKKNKKAGLGQLSMVTKKLRLREQAIANINDQLDMIQGDISQSRNEIDHRKKELDTLKAQYTKSVVYAYKNRSNYDFLNFIFSAASFNDALKRVEYLKSYRQYRETQADAIKERQQVLHQKIAGLESSQKRKSDALQEQEKEKVVLVEERKEKDEIVSKLKAREREINKELTDKQRADKKLRDGIMAAIRREADRERAEAAKREKAEAAAAKKAAADKPASNNTANAPVTKPAASRPKSVFEATPEGELVTGAFEKSKGKLPWPVDKGQIKLHFGPYRIEAIKINGNNPGLTLETEEGAAVKVVYDGEVSSIFDVDGTTAVFVRHGKYFTTYSGLSSVSVSKGQQVKAGQVLGKAGSNSEGNGEIDFVLMQDTRNIDPEPWIKRR